MVNKDMNECLTSSGMRKMKTTAEQHCTPSRAATVICETDTTKYLEPPQPSYATGRSRVSATALDHGFTVSTKETPYPSDPTTPFLDQHLTKTHVCEPRDAGQEIYYGIIHQSPSWKQPAVPTRGCWVDEL